MEKQQKQNFEMINSLDSEQISKAFGALKHSANLGDDCTGWIESFHDRPQWLRPAAAFALELIHKLGSQEDIDRIEHAVSEAGIGAIEPREEVERVRQQLRSTVIGKNDFWIAANLLSELLAQQSCRSIWNSANRKMQFDVIAVMLVRTVSDDWARKQLRKTFYGFRGDYSVKAQQLIDETPWLEPEIEQRVGKPEPSYLVRLIKSTGDSICEPQGSVGLVALTVFVFFSIWGLNWALNANASIAAEPKHQPSVESKASEADASQQPEQATFEELVQQRLESLSVNERNAIFVVLPTILDSNLLDMLSENLSDATIIGPDRLRIHGVHSTPKSHGWFPVSLQLLNLPESLLSGGTSKGELGQVKDVYVVQLRVDSLNRPVLEIADPESGQVLILLLGDEEMTQSLLHGRKYVPPCAADYLRSAEAAMGRNNDYAKLFLRLAQASSDSTFERGKVWKTQAQIHESLKEVEEGDIARRMADFYESIDD